MPLRHSAPANLLRWATNFRGQRRTIGRRYLFDALARLTPSVAVDTDGLRLYLSTADGGASRTTFAEGVFDRRLLTRVSEELERIGAPALQGRGFLDIGANIGTASCMAVKTFGASRSWAFEPFPDSVRLLRLNVVANGLEHCVEVHACALSDHEGSMSFALSAVNWGDHRITVVSDRVPPPTRDESRRPSIDVPTLRLDDLVDSGTVDLASVGLAWIDVQGHEAHVLHGAMKLLRSDIPIVCEYWPYGLRRAASLDRFHALVSRERTTFIDLGRPDRVLRPSAKIADLHQHYPGEQFTDVLLLPG